MFDVVYDEKTNDVLEILKNPNDGPFQLRLADVRFIYPKYYEKKITVNSVSWINYIPDEIVNNSSDYRVKFINNYSKPLFLENKQNKTNFNLGLNTKILDKSIFWYGPMLDFMSYANISRDISFELLRQGYNITLCPSKVFGRIEISQEEQDIINKNRMKYDELIKDTYLRVISYIPLYKVAHSAYNVIYTMLETFDVHRETMDCIKTYFNEVWVPTYYAKNQWRDYFSEKMNLKVMPLWFNENRIKPGVEKCDVNFYLCNEDKEAYSKTPSGFKFLCIARYSQRKGIDTLINAFLREFKKSDDVSLVLFSRHILNVECTDDDIKNRVKKLMEKHATKDSPPIYLYDKPVTNEQQPGMYGWGDCFVLPSRGEGFCLPVIEAAACRIPVIAPNHTGLSDFMSDKVGYVLNIDEIDSCGKVAPNREKKTLDYDGKYPEWREWITNLYYDRKFAVMGEKVEAQLMYYMRGIQNRSFSDTEEKIDNFYELVHKLYTWERCFGKIQDRIDYILDQNS